MNIMKLAAIVVSFIIAYLIGYIVNSALGGYSKYPEMDGRDRYSGSISMANAIKWKPVLGDWLVHDGDAWGYIFYPMLMWDRGNWHKTHYITDKDFFEWAKTVPKDQWK